MIGLKKGRFRQNVWSDAETPWQFGMTDVGSSLVIMAQNPVFP
jgi:hypothetical protein